MECNWSAVELVDFTSQCEKKATFKKKLFGVELFFHDHVISDILLLCEANGRWIA